MESPQPLATPWNDDPSASKPVIAENIRQLIPRLQHQAQGRATPSVAMAQEWHRAIYAGVRLPVPYYAGEVRDSDPDFPELIGYEVRVGSHRGVLSQRVPDQLTAFEASIQQATANVDAAIPVGAPPADQRGLLAVVRLSAIAHGEWVRIHPFANGNGRIARLWANWIGMRYALPPFVSIKPRPAALLYAGAAAQSMEGDHDPMVVVFNDMLRNVLVNGTV